MLCLAQFFPGGHIFDLVLSTFNWSFRSHALTTLPGSARIKKRPAERCAAMKSLTVLLVALGLVAPFNLRAQNHIGIMLSGYEDDCRITHGGKTVDCDEQRQIYLGDTIRKTPSVKALKIKWAPYVKGVARSETLLEAVADKPDAFKGKGYAGAAKQYLQDFVKPAQYATTAAVTRDPLARSEIPVRATLLEGFPMKLPQEGLRVKSVVVSNAKGDKVSEKQVNGDGLIVLSTEELRLAQGETYRVKLQGEGASRGFTASLLSKDLQDEVRQGLAEIDAERLPSAEAATRKAAYLQMISDLYPETIDLYWLSLQFLHDRPASLTKDQQEAFEALKNRYYGHRSQAAR